MRKLLLTILAAITLLMPSTLVLSAPAYAACGNASDAKGQALQGIGESGNNCNDSGVTNVVTAIITIMSIVVGIVAIVMIIFAGLRYITSGGDSGKVTTAKNTLIYAIIGIAVVALAQTIVHFTVNVADNATKPPSSSKKK